MKWLHDKGHVNIYEPFDKALVDYSESISRPEKLRDVVTDMYEALEATAKVVIGKDRTFTANRELFISKLGLGDHHKNMLKAYDNYASELFRHAQDPSKPRAEITTSEAEDFIYLTGIYTRFAIQKLEEQG